MYSVGLEKGFTALHHNPGAKGPEARPHEHAYSVRLVLEGEEVGPSGFLVDLLEVEAVLDAAIGRLGGKDLNALDEFRGRVPSVELVSRTLWEAIATAFRGRGLLSAEVRVREDDYGWGAYRGPL